MSWSDNGEASFYMQVKLLVRKSYSALRQRIQWCPIKVRDGIVGWSTWVKTDNALLSSGGSSKTSSPVLSRSDLTKSACCLRARAMSIDFPSICKPKSVLYAFTIYWSCSQSSVSLLHKCPPHKFHFGIGLNIQNEYVSHWTEFQIDQAREH